MRALVFGFVRDRIFFSDCWTALHFEGYMLRELQQIIQKITPAGTLESLHRASLESMLSTNHQFEHCWIRKEVEDAQCQFMELFSPLLDLQEFEDIKDQIKRDLEIIFTGAFKARARFVPPLGARYELVQFKPGDKFDPAYMQVQGASSKPISVPSDGSVYRIKACVHGCLIEHSAKKKLSYADMLQVLSQPLIGDDERFDITEKGVLKSDRAIIILEDESAP
ncbi:hypothetical protein N7507_011645 [Penicillium longicatenatum]|nr:hypothetical protein N7507_011645 [Penicillium longicatenatum]